MKLVLKCLVFLTIFKVISCSNDDNTKIILSHMQDWGEEIFKTLTGKNRGQYLVAALLSDDDLNTPHQMPDRLLKGCPNKGPDQDKQMIMCSTSGVFLNRKSEEILKRSRWNDTKYEDHPWHGEYILLREGFIEKLVKNFGKDKNCQVYLYSFFIPCADISNCPYSCSEEILMYNTKGNISCKITVIGYTNVFRRPNSQTNEEIAKVNIHSARAQLFKNIGNVKVEAINAINNRNRMVPFQELFFLCLNESPLSGCCISKSGVLSSGSYSIIAFYVNYIVFDAINSLKADLEGKNRKTYLKRFYHLIKRTISSHCNVCPHKMYHKIVAQFCVKTAIKLASGFGEPLDYEDMSLPSWTYTGKT